MANPSSQSQRDAVTSTLCVAESKMEPHETGLQSKSSPPPPNGGLVAWLQIAGAFCLFFNPWGLATAYGVFQTYYSVVLLSQLDNSTISWIGSLSTFLIAASPIIWGPMYDRGHPRLLIIAGTFLVVFGLMMTSLCTQFWHLILAQGVCVGLGGGCLFLTSLAIVPTYFTSKRAIANGIAASGSSIAGVIYPVVFHELQPKIGFGWTIRVIAFIALSTLALPCFVIRARVKPTGPRRLFDIAVMKDVAYEVYNLASLFGCMGQYVPFFYIELYAVSHGIHSKLSFYMLAFMSSGSVFGRIIPGILADKKLHPLVVLSTCTGCAGILCFCWIAIEISGAGLIVFSILYGFFSGAFVSLQAPAIARMTTDFSKIGTKLGINAFFSALRVLIGSPSGGAIQRKSWAGMQAFAGSALVISAYLVFTTKMMHDKSQRGKTPTKV